MSKVLVDIVLRSVEKEEVEPGIFEYKYYALEKMKAEKTFQGKSYENNQTINTQTSSTPTFSVTFPHKYVEGERSVDFVYLKYNGRFYEISNMEYYPPRVKLFLGPVSKTSFNDLKERGLLEYGLP